MQSSSAGTRQSAVGSSPAPAARPDDGRTGVCISAFGRRLLGPARSAFTALVPAVSTLRTRSSVSCQSNDGLPRPECQTIKPGLEHVVANSGTFTVARNLTAGLNGSGLSRWQGLMRDLEAESGTRPIAIWTWSCLDAVEFQKYCKGES